MVTSLTKRDPKALIIAAFAAIYIIWGSTYLGILLAIKTIPPFLMAGARFLLAGGLLLTWAFIKGERLPEKNSLIKISFSGILMLFLGNGAVVYCEQFLPSGLAAIIVATVPLWFVLLDKRQWKFYFSNWQIIAGLLVGFAGVILLFAGKAAGDLFNSHAKLVSLFVLIGGTIAWTAGTLFSKYRKMQGSTIMKVAVQMLAAGICFIIFGLILNEQKNFSFSRVSAESLWALAYLFLFGSVVAYLAYMWLLSIRPASLVGTYAYVNPAVAVFLGWLVANESISIQQGIGLGVIIIGLIIVNFSKEKTTVIKMKTKEEKESREKIG